MPAAPQVGLRPEEVERADWIVVGHSHFDHLYGAERIAKRTGARIIGSHETVRVMEAQGVPLDRMVPVAGGERVRLSDDVVVDVYPSQHSCVWSQRVMSASDEVCIGDLGLTLQEQQLRLHELAAHFGTLGPDVIAHLIASSQKTWGDGGAFVYHFRTPEGSVFYQDTSGHWSGILRDLRPDVQVDLLRPRRVVLSHHDDWLPGFSRAIDVKPIRDEIARVRPATELVEMGYGAAYPLFKART